jgi:hypothetical protein
VEGVGPGTYRLLPFMDGRIPRLMGSREAGCIEVACIDGGRWEVLAYRVYREKK